MTIWKYPLDVTDTQVRYLPVGARILCVQTQNGIPCIWALVDEKAKVTQAFVLRTFGTGHPVESPDTLTYVGTYQMHDGGLVFHVFQE